LKLQNILVVDDNAVNRKLACDLLESEGYLVRGVPNAERALEEISFTTPDLILMDIGLPGMDGLTLTRKLKTDEITKSIHVIALTAFAMKGDYEKAMDAGCDGYISKPIETRKFVSQILEILKT